VLAERDLPAPATGGGRFLGELLGLLGLEDLQEPLSSGERARPASCSRIHASQAAIPARIASTWRRTATASRQACEQ
jgi:hypothetical protein